MSLIEFEGHENFGVDLVNERGLIDWIERVITNEGMRIGHLSYFFCSDEDLLDINKKSLGHDYYTDVISFDCTVGDVVSGEIHISIDRIKENAIQLKEPFFRELLRVMIHGVLHFIGYSDKDDTSRLQMRKREDECLLFHVEHIK